MPVVEGRPSEPASLAPGALAAACRTNGQAAARDWAGRRFLESGKAPGGAGFLRLAYSTENGPRITDQWPGNVHTYA